MTQNDTHAPKKIKNQIKIKIKMTHMIHHGKFHQEGP